MKKSYTSSEEKITLAGNPIKSLPLHVQSRINKRKRSGSLTHSNGGLSSSRKRSRGDIDSNFVDITSLLVLPQKEAASRLGISESMLCKRFKESTRRKWPYRYLRKIDKMMHMLTLNKKGDTLAQEDLEKIERLKSEREECLHPVKIRITGQDLDRQPSNSADSESYEDALVVDQKNVEECSDSLDDLDLEGDDEIAQVITTLNLMRQAVCT